MGRDWRESGVENEVRTDWKTSNNDTKETKARKRRRSHGRSRANRLDAKQREEDDNKVSVDAV